MDSVSKAISAGSFLTVEFPLKKRAYCCVCNLKLKGGDIVIELMYNHRVKARMCSPDCKTKFIEKNAARKTTFTSNLTASERRWLSQNRIVKKGSGFSRQTY